MEDAGGDGAGGTTAGSSGGAAIGSGVRVGEEVGAVGALVTRRGAGDVAWRARVVGAATAREVGTTTGREVGGGAAIASTTTEPGGRAGSDRDRPSVSQPIRAQSIA